ncbi:MAG: dethiobiotin synthase [Solirubrobacteraceae bacterium]
MSARPPGLFVTGTGTDVGKTVLSATLIAAMRAAGMEVIAHKPAVSGLDQPDLVWPADHVLLGSLCGMPAEQVAPLRYGPAVSPHMAASLLGEPVADGTILAAARSAAELAARRSATLVVEGVGGLLVPLTDTLSVRALAAELALPLLIAARPGLGTINHALLSIEAARAADLDVHAVVLTPWPADPSPMELSNRATIERLGEVEVAGLPLIAGPDPALLGAAAEQLSWRSWLDA